MFNEVDNSTLSRVCLLATSPLLVTIAVAVAVLGPKWGMSIVRRRRVHGAPQLKVVSKQKLSRLHRSSIASRISLNRSFYHYSWCEKVPVGCIDWASLNDFDLVSVCKRVADGGEQVYLGRAPETIP